MVLPQGQRLPLRTNGTGDCRRQGDTAGLENGYSQQSTNYWRYLWWYFSRYSGAFIVCAPAISWRDAASWRVAFNLDNIQKPTIRCVALGRSLVFNVASQKNAISDGFCPFLSALKSSWVKRRQQVCMTHLYFGTVRKVYLVRSI